MQPTFGCCSAFIRGESAFCVSLFEANSTSNCHDTWNGRTSPWLFLHQDIQWLHENNFTLGYPGKSILWMVEQFLTVVNGSFHNPTKCFHPSKSSLGPSLWTQRGGMREKGGISRLICRTLPGLSSSTTKSWFSWFPTKVVVSKNELWDFENLPRSLKQTK